MEGGQLLSGKIDLRPVIVDGDLGQYVIAPEKIKMIRFLKPVNEVKPGDEAEGNNNGERRRCARKAGRPRGAREKSSCG